MWNKPNSTRNNNSRLNIIISMKGPAISLPFIFFYLFFFRLLFFAMADESNKFQTPQDQKPLIPEGGLGAILVRGSPTGNTAPAKTEWPEVVGLTAEDAEKKIKEDMPNATVQAVEPDHFVTMDFNDRRVRLYLDSAGSVARPAKLG